MKEYLELTHFLKFISKNLSCILASALIILLLHSSLVSITLFNTFAQSRAANTSLRDIIDERTSQALDNAKKLRQVAGEKVTESLYCSIER